MTTKHNHLPNFGRKVADCARCEELTQGAEPVKWAESRSAQDQHRLLAVRAHFDSDEHKSGRCGAICTYGEW